MRKTKASRLRLSQEEFDAVSSGLTAAWIPVKQLTESIATEYKLGSRGPWILRQIERGQVVNPSDVRKMFPISFSVITDELARLQKARLISYQGSNKDRRRVELGVTPLGLKVVGRIRRLHRDAILDRLSSYSREQVLLLARMLHDFLSGKAVSGKPKSQRLQQAGESPPTKTAPRPKRRG